tara:strand:- start:542 stop:1465 length:924 start_codon:yes stop_codon:yes gene_type:complete
MNTAASDEGVSFTVTIDGEDTPPVSEEMELSDHMLSPSRINMFLKCPRSYYYRYIEKLPEKLTIHLFRGSMVHSILEDLFEKRYKFASGYQRGQAQAWVTEQFEERWADLVDTKPWLFKDYKEEVFRKETLEMLVNFCAKIERKLKELMDWEVYRTKDLAFKNLKPTFNEMRLRNKEMKVQGIIDAVVTDFEKNISLIDYKTSKRYGPWLPEDYYRQLIIYAMLYYEETGIVPMFCGVDWLRFDTTTFVRITSSELDEARALIRDMHKELIERGTDIEKFEVKPMNLCKWCAFYKNPCEPGSLKPKK